MSWNEGFGQLREIVFVVEDRNGIDIDHNLCQSDSMKLRSIEVDSYLSIARSVLESTDYCMQITFSNDEPLLCGNMALSYRQRCEVRKKLNELLGAGIIHSSDAPYASAVVLVKKKNQELRMCID